MRPQAFGKTNGFLAKFKIKEAWIELLLLTHVCHDTSVFGQNVGGGNRKGRRRRRKCASALLLSPLTLHNRREFFAEEGCRVSRAVEKESRVLHILHLERTHTHMLQTMSSGLLPDGPPSLMWPHHHSHGWYRARVYCTKVAQPTFASPRMPPPPPPPCALCISSDWRHRWVVHAHAREWWWWW